MSFGIYITTKIRKNSTYIVSTCLDRNRRQAVTEIRTVFRQARRGRPIECHCDEQNRPCECFTPGAACEQRLIAQIMTSGSRCIFWLMQAVRAFVLPGRPMPTYKDIQEAAMLRLSLNIIEN